MSHFKVEVKNKIAKDLIDVNPGLELNYMKGFWFPQARIHINFVYDVIGNRYIANVTPDDLKIEVIQLMIPDSIDHIRISNEDVNIYIDKCIQNKKTVL